MNTSNLNNGATLFYFNHVKQLADFESFEVVPVHNKQQLSDLVSVNSVHWSVIGELKAEKVKAFQSSSFPVADLPTELYANLFAQMCREVVSNTLEGVLSKSLTDALKSQTVTARD